MLKVFNTPALTRRQRFGRALAAGSAAALAGVGLLVLIMEVFGFHTSLLYIAIGFGIGYAIQYFGRGVQLQFSLLAAGLTAAVMLVGDLLWYGSPAAILAVFTQFGTDSLLELAYRLVAGYLAFRYARVV